MDERLVNIIEAFEDVANDSTVPRNIKTRITEIIAILKSEEELSIRINKALSELDEISDDTNIQPYTRTQIWNIASLLETIC